MSEVSVVLVEQLEFGVELISSSYILLVKSSLSESGIAVYMTFTVPLSIMSVSDDKLLLKIRVKVMKLEVPY